ncbi:MAG: chromate transporter [Fibrobacter sp.]|nr:chromate transporter [Fibrobacter sp.]
MIFLQLFITFFKIGLFGFGGGYGMLSLIQQEVVKNHPWMSSADFTDIVAISQMTPGPVGINSATYAGYTALQNTGADPWVCVLGSCVATFSLVLPSLILMLLISRFFMKYADHPKVRAVFDGLRPAVVGLLLAATLMLMNAENFGNPFTEILGHDFGGNPADTKQFAVGVALFVLTFVFTKGFTIGSGDKARKVKIGPIKMIVMAAIVGAVIL